MNEIEALKEFEKLAKSMARSAATDHVLMSADDLFQEANIAILRAVRQPHFPSIDEERWKFVRSCILNAFRNLAAVHSEGPGCFVSLDEEIGEDDSGNPMTRHDVIGCSANQEGAEATSRTSDRAVRKLSGETQEMLAMRAKGRTIDEIGEAFGISHQAVSQRIKKARKALKTSTEDLI